MDPLAVLVARPITADHLHALSSLGRAWPTLAHAAAVDAVLALLADLVSAESGVSPALKGSLRCVARPLLKRVEPLALFRRQALQCLAAGWDTVGWCLDHYNDVLRSRSAAQISATVLADFDRAVRDLWAKFSLGEPNSMMLAHIMRTRLLRGEAYAEILAEIPKALLARVLFGVLFFDLGLVPPDAHTDAWTTTLRGLAAETGTPGLRSALRRMADDPACQPEQVLRAVFSTRRAGSEEDARIAV